MIRSLAARRPPNIVLRCLAVLVGATLVAGVSAGAFDLLRGRNGPQPVASVQNLDLGPAPAPLERPEPSPATFEEPQSAAQAVDMFLRAEADGRFELSYALLDARSRKRYPVLASWVADQVDRPKPLRLNAASVDPRGAGETVRVPVQVDVARDPAIDPFIGFVAAEATETWLARLDGGKWRVQDRPAGTDPRLPPDAEALEVAATWVRHAQDCDRTRSAALQVEPVLYGVAQLVEELCGDDSVSPSGVVQEFDPDAEGAGALAAFGPGIDVWARSVDVDASQPFRLILGPLGSEWRVLAIAPLSEEVGT